VSEFKAPSPGDKTPGPKPKAQRSSRRSRVAQLGTILRRWGLRLRVAESLVWGPWGAAVGLGLGLLLALAARVWPLLMVPVLAALAGTLALAGTTVGLAAVWLRPRSPWRLARIFDRRFGLGERLTTAVEISTARLRATATMARAQLADTLAAAAWAEPRIGVLLPLRASRPALLAFGVLALGLTLSLWLPNAQEDVLLQRAAVREAIAEQIEELGAAREEVAEVEGLSQAEREALLQALEEAIVALDEALDEGRAMPEEAIATLSEAEQALTNLQDPGAAAVREGMGRAAEGMRDSELTREMAEALDSGDYSEAARALAAYSGTKGEALTREEELELARELAEAAESLAGGDPELARQLAQAAEAIERGEIAEARVAIGDAARELGEAGERVARQEAVEGTLAELQEGREQIARAGST
jgi:hypothetical protein